MSVIEPRVGRFFFNEAVLSTDVVSARSALGPTAIRLLLALATFFFHARHVTQPLVVLAFAAAAAAAHRQGHEEDTGYHTYRDHRTLQRDKADAPVDLGESGALIVARNELLVRVVATPPGFRAIVTPSPRCQAVRTRSVGFQRAGSFGRDGWLRGRYRCRIWNVGGAESRAAHQHER